jgi:hypothetical protein
MGSHADGASIAAAIHTSEFGAVYAYTAPGAASPANRAAIAYPVQVDRRTTNLGTMEVQVRDLIVEIAVLASPVINGMWLIDGDDWIIEKMSREGNRWRLSLLKIKASEITRNQYRRGVR